MTEPIYAERFQDQVVVEQYEQEEYAKDSYSSYIWQLQRPVLQKMIQAHQNENGPTTLLDFACGTGRILSFVEQFVDNATGLDISEDMAKVARTKCRKANVSVGNILSDRSLASGSYDIVTCFRFFLNTEQNMRVQILNQLRQRLAKPRGVLIMNIHGNRLSSRHWALQYKKRFNHEAHNELSPLEVRDLFEQCGFEIVECLGFGIVPPTLYRTPLRFVAQIIDRVCTRHRFLDKYSIDLLYICKPID